MDVLSLEPAIRVLIFLIPGLIVAIRTIWPLDLPLAVRGVLALAALLGTQHLLWSRLSSGSVFAPEFPRPLVILSNWALGTIIMLACGQVVLDLLSLVVVVATGWEGEPDAARYVLGAAAATLTATGVRLAIRVPDVRELQVKVRGLHAAFHGYVILQLSDLHISRLFPAAWTRAVVARANGLGADMIVVTGDLIDGTIAQRRNDVAPLRDLRAPDGVVMIPGNHEYFFDGPAWLQLFASLGLRPLCNAHVTIARDDGRLVVAGVTDASAARHGLPGPDLGAALDGAPAEAPVVLLDHQPRHARRAARAGVALQLSGHTHGGLIAGPDRLFASANGGFVSGRYEVEGMTLYVSNGTGLWPGFALRLGRPSELTRITLRPIA